jgi:hypothetical protein
LKDGFWWKDPDPDPDLWLMNPDQEDPKTYGSYGTGSRSGTLISDRNKQADEYANVTSNNLAVFLLFLVRVWIFPHAYNNLVTPSVEGKKNEKFFANNFSRLIQLYSSDHKFYQLKTFQDWKKLE